MQYYQSTILLLALVYVLWEVILYIAWALEMQYTYDIYEYSIYLIEHSQSSGNTSGTKS